MAQMPQITRGFLKFPSRPRVILRLLIVWQEMEMMIQTIKTLKLNFTYVNLDKIFFLNDMRLILFTRPDCTYFFPLWLRTLSFSISK